MVGDGCWSMFFPNLAPLRFVPRTFDTTPLYECGTNVVLQYSGKVRAGIFGKVKEIL